MRENAQETEINAFVKPNISEFFFFFSDKEIQKGHVEEMLLVVSFSFVPF